MQYNTWYCFENARERDEFLAWARKEGAWEEKLQRCASEIQKAEVLMLYKNDEEGHISVRYRTSKTQLGIKYKIFNWRTTQMAVEVTVAKSGDSLSELLAKAMQRTNDALSEEVSKLKEQLLSETKLGKTAKAYVELNNKEFPNNKLRYQDIIPLAALSADAHEQLCEAEVRAGELREKRREELHECYGLLKQADNFEQKLSIMKTYSVLLK